MLQRAAQPFIDSPSLRVIRAYGTQAFNTHTHIRKAHPHKHSHKLYTYINGKPIHIPKRSSTTSAHSSSTTATTTHPKPAQHSKDSLPPPTCRPRVLNETASVDPRARKCLPAHPFNAGMLACDAGAVAAAAAVFSCVCLFRVSYKCVTYVAGTVWAIYILAKQRN